MSALKLPIITENFEGFAMLRTSEVVLNAEPVQEILRTLGELVSKGESLIFIDLAVAKEISASDAMTLSLGIAQLRETKAVELVLLCEPSLTAQLNSSPLRAQLKLFERKDNTAQRVASEKILIANISDLYHKLESTIEGAINAGVSRWTGEPPVSIKPVSAIVNPGEDVVSTVNMLIDGCEFQVYLSCAQTTLRKMVAHILKEDISVTDPAIFDAACELLNYLTAYFRQHLTNEDGAVVVTPPRLLVPEEMMAILEQNLPAQRVQTQHGQFDVWIEAY